MAGTGKGPTPRQREFGNRVRQRRQALGISQEELAHRSGINRTYIGSLETGGRNPSLDNIARLAIGLDCDAAELVAGLEELAGRGVRGDDGAIGGSDSSDGCPQP